ncbi:RNA polymerase sigma-54 factor [Amedibacillus dolichus]|uniref:RNA polymerase factor sigma-54 n=1 Tax=Amedibacillus dolichus TaxID=31971 RepID=UPI0039A20573
MEQKLLFKPDIKQKANFHSAKEQSLQILQMNQQALQMYLQEQVNRNPFLAMNTTFEDVDIFDVYTSKQSLSDVLYEQLRYGKEKYKEEVVDYLISQLNSNGYFKVSFEQLVFASQFSEKELIKTIRVLQCLEPIGCFCFSLKECLQIQCEMHEEACSETGYILCDYLEDLALHRFALIEEKTQLSYEEIEEGFHFIQGLNPKPASNYATQSMMMIPEIRVKVEGEHLVLETVQDMFRLQLEEEIEPHHERLKRQRQEAMLIMNSLQKRKMTILQIMQFLVEKQKAFFLEKKPLCYCTLQEVAKACGLHASTISRAIQNKCFDFQTTYYPIKYLLVHGGDKTHNSNEIKNRIKKLIETEDKMHPYSDECLRKLLEKEGIMISRRTVSKYREACLLFNASQRKQREGNK